MRREVVVGRELGRMGIMNWVFTEREGSKPIEFKVYTKVQTKVNFRDWVFLALNRRCFSTFFQSVWLLEEDFS